jgi:hypothetical protein
VLRRHRHVTPAPRAPTITNPLANPPRTDMSTDTKATTRPRRCRCRGVGGCHAQLDRAHDRVGNNRRRADGSLRYGCPRCRGERVLEPESSPTEAHLSSTIRHLHADNSRPSMRFLHGEPVNDKWETLLAQAH